MIEVVAANGSWRPAPGQRPPRDFLWGDPEQQNFGMGGEQKHLAETLRLFIDVTSIRCRSCRRANRAIRCSDMRTSKSSFSRK